MRLHRWTFARKPSLPRPAAHRPRRLGVESLEDRCVPTAFIVNSLADTVASDGAVTLREAITAANTNAASGDAAAGSAGADTISFAPSLVGGTITLTSALPTISEALTITGLGRDSLTVSGAGQFRVFDVAASAAQVGISDLAISQGNAGTGSGGGVQNAGPATTLTNLSITGGAALNGGGIVNTGTLTLTGSSLVGNSATGNGGGIDNDNNGTLTIDTSTIADNTAIFGGGLQLASGTATITASTFSGNGAQQAGGGIRSISVATAPLQITNSTLAHNVSLGGTGGGAISSTGGAVTLLNSTVAFNTDASGLDQGAGGISKLGGTLTLNNSVVASNFGAIATPPNVSGGVDTNNSSVITGNPLLGPLQNNGGPTQTIAPLLGSPLIDAGSNTLATALATDQRGLNRVAGSTVDVGAVEFQPPQVTVALTASATNTSTSLPVTLTATVTGSGTNANTPTGSVTFLAGTTVLGTAPVGSDGTATLTVPSLPAGASDLTARFTPANANVFNAGVSATVTVTALRTQTVGQFDPTSGNWFLRNQNSGGPFDFGFVYGLAGWNPVVGDWNGDGVDSIGIVDPTSNTFFLRNENSGGLPDAGIFPFGSPTQRPLAGHWTGLSKDGVGVYDATTSTFTLRPVVFDTTPMSGQTVPADIILPFGMGGRGLIPVSGDWDGTGTTKVGLFDPSTGTWMLRTSNDPNDPGVITFQYGGAGWQPVVGDWDGNGTTTIAVVDPAGNWYIRNSNSAGAPDITPFPYGLPFWHPVAGNWGPAALPAALLSADGAGAGATPLSAEQLGAAVDSALSQLSAAQVGRGLLNALRSANYVVGDLPAGWLGATYRAQNVAVLSADAAGWGWSGHGGSMDLDSALLHEMGHLAGLADDGGNDLMGATLAPGQAHTDALDAVFARGV